MSQETKGAKEMSDVVESVTSSLPLVSTEVLLLEILMRTREQALEDLLHRSVEITELGESSQADLDEMRVELVRAYQEQLGGLLAVRASGAPRKVPTYVDWLRSLASPISLMVAAAALGGSLVVVAEAWQVAAVLVGIAMGVAWMAKLEHDRRFADVLATAREAAAASGDSLAGLGEALTRARTSVGG